MTTTPAARAVAPVVLEPVTINHAITARVEALSPATVAEVGAVELALAAIAITDEATLAKADEIYQKARTLRSGIEKQREALKAPVLQLGREIDAAAKPALAVLDAGLATARTKVDAWNAKVRAEHEAKVRAAQEEARRQQAEIDRKAEEERKAREAAAAAERKRVEEEAAALAELTGTPAEPTPAAPPAPAPAPFQRTIVKPAFVAPPPLSKAVGSRKEKRAQINDARLIPTRIGDTHLVKEWDLAAIQRVLELGIPVPGCELIEVTITTSK